MKFERPNKLLTRLMKSFFNLRKRLIFWLRFSCDDSNECMSMRYFIASLLLTLNIPPLNVSLFSVCSLFLSFCNPSSTTNYSTYSHLCRICMNRSKKMYRNFIMRKHIHTYIHTMRGLSITAAFIVLSLASKSVLHISLLSILATCFISHSFIPYFQPYILVFEKYFVHRFKYNPLQK